MAYIDTTNDNFLRDINSRKEYAALTSGDVNISSFQEQGIYPRFVLENYPEFSEHVISHTYQRFCENFINPNTPYTRLLVMHNTGSGKTLTAIKTAMSFIPSVKSYDSSIFVLGFHGTKRAFFNELTKFPEFGFISRNELETYKALRKSALAGIVEAAEKIHTLKVRLNKRLHNREGNGYFEFIGYKELTNRLEDEDFMLKFENSVIICDEAHHLYNSVEQNTWGNSIQKILSRYPTIRILYLTATPINNSPTEIVDLANLLVPHTNPVTVTDWFDAKFCVKQESEAVIRKTFTGYVSYLVDSNPALFPSYSYIGEEIVGGGMFRFVRCFMDEHYKQTYKAASQSFRNYINDYVLPNYKNEKIGIYENYESSILEAPEEWKASKGIGITKYGKIPIVSGRILNITTLHAISPKYHKMMEIILDLLKSGGGKMLIYNNNIIASGVFFISEIFMENGFIEYGNAPSNNTVCSICGDIMLNHDVDLKEGGHLFAATTYCLIHSKVNDKEINRHIDDFNHEENRDGKNIMILLCGSKIKESYTLSSVRHLFVTNRPVNISTFIQIRGRCVRKNSHLLLSPERRTVAVYLLVLAMEGSLTTEEESYISKIKDYSQIRKLETIIESVAVDSIINHATIYRSGVTASGDAMLPLDDTLSKSVLSKNSMSKGTTFDVYFSEAEVKEIIFIIKRAFIEISSVWRWDDLVRYVKKPAFKVQYNTSKISTDNIVVAVSRLLHNIDLYSNFDIQYNIIDSLFNHQDVNIYTPNSPDIYYLQQKEDFYFLVNRRTGNVYSGVDEVDTSKAHSVDIEKYIISMSGGINYPEKRHDFVNTYKDVDLNSMRDAVCTYGAEFHSRFVEDVIEYVFMHLTSGTIDETNHEFYYKMVYYYDTLGLILFASSVKENVYEIYKDYLDETLDTREEISRGTRQITNMMLRQMRIMSCDWCPDIAKKEYQTSIQKSLNKTRSAKVDPDILPVGHFMRPVLRFYHPIDGWYSDDKYVKPSTTWKENPVIIGMNVKSDTGLHIKFKLRAPHKKEVRKKDGRTLKTGVQCNTISKKNLIDICKRIGAVYDNVLVSALCDAIRTRLLYLELVERYAGSNIKYMYNQFEIV